MKSVLAVLLSLLLVGTGFPQQPSAPARNSYVAGVFYAANYAYGATSPAVKVVVGNSAAGAASITLSAGAVALPDGRVVQPFSTSAPITIGVGSVQETVTPSAVSNCYAGAQSGVCTLTATFTYVHGQGDIVRSGTAGLQEAIMDAKNRFSGGQVVVDGYWSQIGGTSTMITSTAIAQTGVGVTDQRSTGPVFYGKSGSSYVAVFSIGATTNTLVAPVISGGLTASGSASNDFSGSTGTFKTSTGAVTIGGAATITAATPLTLGVAGSVVGSVGFKNATSGTVTLQPVTGALGTVTQSLPAATGTVSLMVSAPCAASGATCTETVTAAGVKTIWGISGVLNGASPSVAAVTFSTGFTSSATYSCTATGNGASAAIAAAGVAITYTSATVVTFTSANAGNWAISFRCIGT